LPWGKRIPSLIANPQPTLHLLETLKNDTSLYLISKKTPQNAGAALGMVGSSPQLSGAADAMSSD
jgi:3-methyladenine DNA glycosylase AlkC